MKQVVRFNVKPTEYLNKVLDKFNKQKFNGTRVIITMVGSYIHITDGYVVIKMPSECVYADGNLGVLEYSNRSKFTDFKEVDSYESLNAYCVFENIKLLNTDYIETPIIGYDSIPNLLSATKYVGKKTTYLNHSYLQFGDKESCVRLKDLVGVKRFINSFGFDLNQAGTIKEYEKGLFIQLGEISIVIANIEIENVKDGLIIGDNFLQESDELIKELGGYDNFRKGLTKYVSKTEEGVCIRNTKHLNKEVYYGKLVIDLLSKLQEINERVLPYIKVSSGVKEEIQTLIIELRSVSLNDKFTFK